MGISVFVNIFIKLPVGTNCLKIFEIKINSKQFVPMGVLN